MNRAIVRDSAGGTTRWHFAGTPIFVDALVSDFDNATEVATVRAAYRAMGLSDGEIDAALGFEFPPVRPVVAVPAAIALTLQCECGITRQTVVTPPEYQTNVCPCGRIWQIENRLSPLLIAHPSRGGTA
jgi:hypothetical protein